MPGLETSQFWTPMILCVAISSVFALLVLYYFRQQINTLDHKINSMFSLITSITNELNRLTMLQAGGDMNFDPNLQPNLQPGLQSSQIEVSDDEEEYDEDEDEEDIENTDFLNKTVLLTSEDLNIDDEDDDEEDDDDEDDDEDDDDEDDDDSIEDTNNEFDTLKIIGEEKSIHLGEEIIDHTQGNDDVKILELETDNLEDLDKQLIESMVELEEIDNLPIVADGYSSDNEDSIEDYNEELVNNGSKSIEIVDYKKLPVKTLREIVVEKGLVQNASKLAKKQLLELLEGN